MATNPPYSRIRRAGALLVTAGILGRTDDGLCDGIDAQLRQGIDNLEVLLATEGAKLGDVVRLVVYLADINDMAALDAVFTERFATPRPARTTVQVAALPAGALVELEATVDWA